MMLSNLEKSIKERSKIQKIYIIIDEMVPETHGNGFGRLASYSALAGFCSMLVFDGLIEKFVS